METEYHPNAIKAGLFVFLMFCVSMYKSCESLQYMFKGKTATARVTQVTEATSSRGNRHIGYTVTYVFVNDNTRKAAKHWTRVGLDEGDDYVPGQEVQIEYLGYEHLSSRIVGTGNTFWLMLFGGVCLAVVGWLAWFMVGYYRQNRSS